MVFPFDRKGVNMSTTILWVGIVTGIVWFFVDYLFYAVIFGKEIGHYNSEDEATKKKKTGGRVTMDLIWDILVGIVFIWAFDRLKMFHGFTGGITSAVKFGLVVWFLGLMSGVVVNWVWFPDLRKLLKVNSLSWLVNFILAGILAGLLV
jgi:hypothetical protein